MSGSSAAAQQFTNASELEFTDISSELWRGYRFAGGEVVRIDQPLKLNVSESGGHRIFDAAGRSHYVPAGWLHLVWEPKEGEPNFVR